MLEEIRRLIQERLDAAQTAPKGMCRACAIEELEEVLSIMDEVEEYYQ